jgi:flagellar motility protein MotE (MotC chaperone)
MSKFRRDFRLVPLVVLATATLFAIKTVALVMDGGFTFGGSRLAQAQGLGTEAGPPSPPRDDTTSVSVIPKVLWLPDTGSPDYTGEIGPTKPKEGPPATDGGNASKPTAGSAETAKPAPDGERVQAGQSGAIDIDRPKSSSGERAILQSLNQRREELDARARDLEMRQNLLAAAEKRLEARFGELKALETKLDGNSHKRDEAETAQFKGLVVMYENMKAKDAARIFDRLDLKVLMDVVGQMNPRKMSDILGQMSAEAAERLTTEIARRAGSNPAESAPNVGDLPKIEGKPSGT